VSGRRDQVHGDGTEVLPAEGNTLLLAPTIGGGERETCMHLLDQHEFARTKVVHVLYMESADERYRAVGRHCGHHPEESAVVAVGSGGVVGRRGPDPPGEYHVTTLADAADLTGLGMTLNECLSGWDEPAEVTLCFDSLSILLQYATVERVFRFLHMLTGTLRDQGATGHFHVDPAAHDESDLAQIRQVFDRVVEVGGDHGWTTVG
jgi:hypothetical protein